MSNAATLMRSFTAYFDGLQDSLDGKPPNKKQWDRIAERVAVMRQLLDTMPAEAPNGHATGQPAAKPADPNVDTVPGGATTTAKWKKNVKKALIEEGCDPESADAYMGDTRFRVDLNRMPGDYAKAMIAGSY